MVTLTVHPARISNRNKAGSPVTEQLIQEQLPKVASSRK